MRCALKDPIYVLTGMRLTDILQSTFY